MTVVQNTTVQAAVHRDCLLVSALVDAGAGHDSANPGPEDLSGRLVGGGWHGGVQGVARHDVDCSIRAGTGTISAAMADFPPGTMRTISSRAACGGAVRVDLMDFSGSMHVTS
jgi:hypothetical protein